MSKDATRAGNDAVHVLCAQLNQLYLQVGAPAFSELQQLSAELRTTHPGVHYLSKSSINDTVRGKRVRLPDWRWVYSFITVCGVHAARHGNSGADDIADPTRWKERWYRAKQGTLDTAPWSFPTVDLGDPSAAQSNDATASGHSADEASPAPTGASPSPADLTRARRFGGLVQSLTASRYRNLFGQHGVDLLEAAERQHDLDACCRLGLLLICVGCALEGEAWLSIAARDGDDPIAVALLHTSRTQRDEKAPNRLEFAAECLYEMAVSEMYRRMKTGDRSPADWIDLYLDIGSRYCRHGDAAYRLAIRDRAHGRDCAAAHWFAMAARKGHPVAPSRFEAIHREIWSRALDEDWLNGRAGDPDGGEPPDAADDASDPTEG
ncbi:hypothetical protein GCM10023195_77490 [Actinoallomurus liliacearum]|uniref:Sel1 repeat family protein n=1 Tax=Actinoallomurus liliacearum TaxID=1080073 RepID=A0ABP8TZI7_9ACTN